MRMRLRHGLRLVTQVTQAAVRTGRWWLPALFLMVAVAALIAHAVAVAVPSATYTLF